jgi:flagellar biosynthetic protein FliS
MTVEMLAGYRATMFDGEPGLDWLRQAWRALKLYARKAGRAIEAGNLAEKGEAVHKADELLLLLTGILDTGEGSRLGPKLMAIYTSLHATLLRANLNNDAQALVDFEQAIDALARDMLSQSRIPTAA